MTMNDGITSTSLRRLLGLWLMLLPLTATAQVNILIEYVDVPEEAMEHYRRVQEQEMKPYHQALLDAGKIYVWYDYQVRFPKGAGASYNHVVVTVLADSSLLLTRDRKIPYREYVAFTEIYRPDYELRSPNYGSMASAYSTINFWHAEPARLQDVRAYMEREMKPTFNGFVDSGQWLTWSVFRRVWPAEAERPYNHVLVTRHAGFDQAEHAAPFSDQAGPGNQPTRIKAELWKLHNIVL